MARIQQIAPFAAFANAVAGVLMLFIAVVLIGPAAMADRKLLLELAVSSPAPLIAQDLLKFVAAAAALVLIGALYVRLATANPKLVWVATGFGLVSVACLLANATLSLTALSRATQWNEAPGQLHTRMNEMIGVTGMAAVLTNGRRSRATQRPSYPAT